MIEKIYSHLSIESLYRKYLKKSIIKNKRKKIFYSSPFKVEIHSKSVGKRINKINIYNLRYSFISNYDSEGRLVLVNKTITPSLSIYS